MPYSKDAFHLIYNLGGCKPYGSPSSLNYGQFTYIIEGEVVDLMVHPLYLIHIINNSLENIKNYLCPMCLIFHLHEGKGSMPNPQGCFTSFNTSISHMKFISILESHQCSLHQRDNLKSIYPL